MTHREVGYMQAALTFLFVIAYFVLLRDFMQGNINVSVEWKETVQRLMDFLTGGLLTMLGYWFARQRTSSDPPTNGNTGDSQ
jgi:hypothetical protein